MGLAASQCRLLFLTSRQNDIQKGMQDTTMRRLALTRATQKITREHNRALDSSVYTTSWQANGNLDVDTMSLNYSKFMTPTGGLGQQFLLTDTSGRVVLSDDYCTKLGIAAGTNSGAAGTITKTLEQFLQAFGITNSNGTSSNNIVGTTFNHYKAMMDTFTNMKTPGAGQAQLFKGWDGSPGGKIRIKDEANDLIAALQPVYSDLETCINNETDQTKKNQLRDQKRVVNNLIQTLTLLVSYLTSGDDNAASVVQSALINGSYTCSTCEHDNDGPIKRIHNVTSALTGLGVDASYTNDDWHTSWCNKHYNSRLNLTDNFTNFESKISANYSNTYGTPGHWTYNGNGDTLPSGETGSSDSKTYYTNLYNAVKNSGWVRTSGIENMSEANFENNLLNGTYKLKTLNSNGSWSEYTNSLQGQGEEVEEEDEDATEELHEKADRKFEEEKAKLNSQETILDLEQNDLETQHTALAADIDSVKKLIADAIKIFKVFEG